MLKSATAKEFELVSVPAATERSAALAAHYRNAVLGDIRVTRAEGATTFDFGEWQSEVGSRENPDGTTSFMTIVPGMTGLEFVVGGGEGKDAHHAGRPARVRVRRDLNGDPIDGTSLLATAAVIRRISAELALEQSPTSLPTSGNAPYGTET